MDGPSDEWATGASADGTADADDPLKNAEGLDGAEKAGICGICALCISPLYDVGEWALYEGVYAVPFDGRLSGCKEEEDIAGERPDG